MRCGWVLGDHSAETFEPLWELVQKWQCYIYVTDGWKVYPGFIPDGDQIVCKRVETETASVSVPVEKERIVIERSDATAGTVVTPGTADFAEGTVAEVEVYEETASIGKQAFVREEVSVRKEVETETVTGSETIRREELEVDADGDVIER